MSEAIEDAELLSEFMESAENGAAAADAEQRRANARGAPPTLGNDDRKDEFPDAWKVGLGLLGMAACFVLFMLLPDGHEPRDVEVAGKSEEEKKK
ncbi:hypothetical protein FVE85_4902 [Porphyridium purpureum]|uniref:Uncharacterized protein n=1 Tax=Porphyridium purpureum TaxID=35688 RepID=A0A5J4YR77_PORPP|nr:hypothetical protein FVE85_4902 [Porphyridium purpureum]|eukprot:POR0029..scf236_6